MNDPAVGQSIRTIERPGRYDGCPAIHVYGELLVGDRGGRTELLASYQQMEQSPLVPHGEVVAFVRDRKLHGRGIGWIDAHLLASALVGRLRLWTADSPLATVAAALGIA